MRVFKWRLGLLGLLCGSSLFASPCMTDTLDNYILLGSGGCTINGEIVDSFSFMPSLGSLLTAGAITVTPSFTATRYQVLFTATGITPSTGFTVSSGSAKYEIDFNWDPLVGGAGDDMDDPPVFPGTATVTTDFCAGCALPFAVGTNTVTIFTDGKPADEIPTAATTFTSPVLIVGTKSMIDLEANGASSTITGFDTFVFITPEPGTAALVAGALLALLMLRRCLRGRRQPGLEFLT